MAPEEDVDFYRVPTRDNQNDFDLEPPSPRENRGPIFDLFTMVLAPWTRTAKRH